MKNLAGTRIKKIKKVVFPVGGLGTRFLPATKALPKEMLPVWNKPLIQYAYEEALNAGIEQFIFITGRNKNAITNHFDLSYELNEVLNLNQKTIEIELTTSWLPKAGQLSFIRQQAPLGLGHAIWCARYMIHENEPFAVILADELLKYPGGFLKEMINLYQDNPGNIIAVAEETKKNISKYGVIKVKNSDNILLEIERMVEKPKEDEAPSNLAIIGRYILDSKIFDFIDPNYQGKEIQLIDSMQKLLSFQKFYGVKYQGERFDCGNKFGLLKANIAFAKDDPEYNHEFEKMLESVNY